MHLFLFVFSILLISIDAMHRPIAPAKLLGFKHLKATELVKAIADDERNEDGKVALYCQYAYCHGLKYIMNCNQYCDIYAILVLVNEKHTYKQRVTKLNKNTKPSADVNECMRVCESDCGSGYVGLACEVLCHIHFSFGNRKEYEVELNTFIGRLRN